MSEKLPKVKHDHKFTDLLKVGIFSIVMLAPVGAIGVTCAYVVCNKNAYQSYSGTAERQEIQAQPLYPTNEFTNQNEMIINNYYYFSLDYTINGTQQSKTAFINGDTGTNIFRIVNIYTKSNFEANPINLKNYCNGYIDYFDFNTDIQLDANFVNLLNGDSDTDQIFDISLNNTYKLYTEFNVSFIFQYLSDNDTFTNDFLSYCEPLPDEYQNYTITTTNVEESTLDNVFYYAVDQMQQSPLFNWTTNTAIFTGVEGMTSGMGINTQAIAILLTYWLICTAIYIIIDIVVKGFTWLTHLIGER